MQRKLNYLDWWHSPHCEAYRWELILGHPPTGEISNTNHWYQYLESTYFKHLNLERWLSLCCGRGDLERHFSREGTFHSCLAVDISLSQVRKAQAAANKLGITNVAYVQGDLNAMSFADDDFDFVIVQGGIHHISRLHHLFSQIKRALKPAGLFVMHEYVGPIRFKLSDFEISQINVAMQLIPDLFRPSLNRGMYFCLRPYEIGLDHFSKRLLKVAYYQLLMLQDGLKKLGHRRYRTYRHYDPDYFQPLLQKDPSEGVSGDNILPTLEKYFDILDVRPIGGTIISWILDFDWGFDLSDPDFLAVVENLISFEKDLINSRKGKVSSHYASIVAKNNK